MANYHKLARTLQLLGLTLRMIVKINPEGDVGCAEDGALELEVRQ